jgi:hypothetical protein
MKVGEDARKVMLENSIERLRTLIPDAEFAAIRDAIEKSDFSHPQEFPSLMITLVPMLTMAVQDLDEQIDVLRDEIADLKRAT